MIEMLFNPQSIVIVGGSNSNSKPGGAILSNILNGNYRGQILVVNPSSQGVQQYQTLPSVQEIHQKIDLAILAIPASQCLNTTKYLIEQCKIKALIILSAGFSETSNEGKAIEFEIIKLANENNVTLLGPNCIGVLSPNMHGIFTQPIPKLDPNGIDFISGSGATAVFFLEQAIQRGLKVNSIVSVGNGNQTGVEEVLHYLDTTFNPNNSSKIKILYIESIKEPQKFLLHSSNLIKKGCKIAAIKAGSSTAGSKAALSHTGAMMSSDKAVDALFEKAGIIRCFGREDLLNTTAVLLNKPLKGNRLAIITHAGGPAVMLSDVLSNNNFQIPTPPNDIQVKLLENLFIGASAQNPFDILATGTANHLYQTLDYCTSSPLFDGVVVIFGSPGLDAITAPLDTILEFQKKSEKPIFAVLPSVINSQTEIAKFSLACNTPLFYDESELGKALVKTYRFLAESTPQHQETKEPTTSNLEILSWLEICDLFKEYKIPFVPQHIVHKTDDLKQITLQYPLVAKVLGINHKTEQKGVILNINTLEELVIASQKLLSISNNKGVLVQEMLQGPELFIGSVLEPKYGHIVSFGMGGIYIELFKDITSILAPVSESEAKKGIEKLKCAPLFKQFRGMSPINEDEFIATICKISKMISDLKSITEIDVNPLIATKNGIFAVDGRITKLKS